jgi:carbamoyltransferase
VNTPPLLLHFGNGNSIELLKEIHFPHSLGLLYSAVTYFLGFKVNSDEYKVMGLAAYGNPASEETSNFISTIESKLIQLNSDGSYQLHMQHFNFTHGLTMVEDSDWSSLFNLPKRKPDDSLNQHHCNLAYAFQKVTEKAVLNLCEEIKAITASDYLCLAGGVALNSVVNGIIKRSNLFREVYIQPASGDAGGALGAALSAYYLHFKNERIPNHRDTMQNSLLGNSYPVEAAESILHRHPNHFICSSEEELCRKTAALIASGKVTGWFQGRMEFGPRALGNRSILADPRNTEMQKHLNLKIKNRESFRPFAPAVLNEDAAVYFEMAGNSPYMLEVHPVKHDHLLKLDTEYSRSGITEKLYTVKSVIPAVTHVDFSARIQTVNKQDHPIFYRLIASFKEQTGLGMVINTSFNIKDEPIVCSPEDAYQCFIKTGMDVLVIDKIIFYK